jgi:dipeptide/tripeptide permease
MEISIFFARFLGSLFISLGLLSIGAGFLGRVIKYTEDRTITVSTGYITFLIGLVTVILHNIWVADWRIAITILGWITLFKGVTKIGFPDHVNKQAQKFKSQQNLWAVVILLLGAVLFWMSFYY